MGCGTARRTGAGWLRPVAVVVSVMLLLGGAGSTWASVDCLEFVAYVNPGDSLTLEAGDEVWIDLLGSIDEVQRLAITGDAGAHFELWTLDSPNDVCLEKDRVIDAGEAGQTPHVVTWTNPWYYGSGLLIAPPEGGGPVTVSLSLEEVAAPPEENVLVVPAVAHITGVGGELFQTDLVVYNEVPLEVEAELVLMPTVGGQQSSRTLTIGPNEIKELDDVVGTVFGLVETTGALRIQVASHRRVRAVSRTYANSEDGTYGQFIPALEWIFAAGRGSTGAVRQLLHLAKSEDSRSNVGFVEVLGIEAVLDLQLTDGTGTVLGSGHVTVPPSSHRQINDIFDFLGAEASDNAWLQVEVLTQARVFSYASVVDNGTSDPVFIRGLVDDWERGISDARKELLVPAAAATHGAHGTRWRTDLRVFPVDETTDSVTVSFFPRDGAPPVSETFDFHGKAPLAIDDVVTSLGASGNGHLWLHCLRGELLATSRTYTLGEGGTYGQFIPAAWVLDDPTHGLVLGLRGTDDFRTNIGLLNTRDRLVDVELRLVSAANEELGRRTYTLPPDQRLQINNVFEALQVSGCEVCRLEYEVEDGLRDVYIHGSVIDNRSGDSVLLPAFMAHY